MHEHAAHTTWFREFYIEVINLKRLIQSEKNQPEMFRAKTDDEKAESGSKALVETVSKRLLHHLEKQELTFNQGVSEGYAYEHYKSTQFVMAALADEIFLQMEWVGREDWQSRLLETKLFKTSAAGGLFFQKLDMLLKQRDSVNLEQAQVYLMALSLGFQGKYRGEEQGSNKLSYYRQELFTMIFDQKSGLVESSQELCPQAYACCLDEGMGLNLLHPRKWLILLGFLVLGMTLVSFGAWESLIFDFEREVGPGN